MQWIEKNEGPKIAFRQDGTRLIFGEGDLIFRCDTRQREYPIHEDICMNEDGNLVIGVGEHGGKYYVAEVDIPAITYQEKQDADTQEQQEEQIEREALPLDMSDVVVTLWSVAGLPSTN